MPSPRFRQFESRVNELEAVFLPPTVRPLGDYTKKEIEGTEAFLVLCHAEVESLLEYKANELLQRVGRHWQKTKISFSLVCLLASLEGEKNFIPSQGTELPPSGRLSAAIQAAINHQNHRILSNNGIKELHFSKLFGPLGIRNTDISQVLLIELTNLGSRRGDIAHKTPSLRTIKITNPFDEQARIKTLIAELSAFDKIVSKTLSALR